jgi:hypothetical protein
MVTTGAMPEVLSSLRPHPEAPDATRFASWRPYAPAVGLVRLTDRAVRTSGISRIPAGQRARELWPPSGRARMRAFWWPPSSLLRNMRGPSREARDRGDAGRWPGKRRDAVAARRLPRSRSRGLRGRPCRLLCSFWNSCGRVRGMPPGRCRLAITVIGRADARRLDGAGPSGVSSWPGSGGLTRTSGGDDDGQVTR